MVSKVLVSAIVYVPTAPSQHVPNQGLGNLTHTSSSCLPKIATVWCTLNHPWTAPTTAPAVLSRQHGHKSSCICFSSTWLSRSTTAQSALGTPQPTAASAAAVLPGPLKCGKLWDLLAPAILPGCSSHGGPCAPWPTLASAQSRSTLYGVP